MKRTFKTKSLVPEYTDEEMNQGGIISFLSFESAIDLFCKTYNLKSPKGYRVTDQGIEIIKN